MKEARSQSIPFVLDADALLLVQEEPDLVRGYKECILTPNVVEFSRLAKAIGVEEDVLRSGDDGGACARLADALGGVTIIQKGRYDHISNGDERLVADIEGGRKRSGGQGDTLTGSLGTFLAWRKAYHDGLWDTGEPGGKMSPSATLLAAAWAGSTLTRDCSRRAFVAKGRSMQASDLTDEVHGSFLSLIGEPEGSKL
jgi:ATP-dependent NAD(P)H-hydrate dehydratase